MNKRTDLWYILGVNAVYGVAHVLLGWDYEGEGEHAGGGHAVVQPEDPAVYVHVRHVQQPTQLTEYFQHGDSLVLLL